MKMILIVDIPDDYEEYGNGDWYVVGDDLKIVYEEDGALMEYKYFGDDIAELKPLPQKKELAESGNSLIDDCKEYYTDGWNNCLDEILEGEE